MKVCRRCNNEKPETAFSKGPRCNEGLSYWCKDCCKKYREENRDRIRQTKKKKYEENRESIIAKVRAYNDSRKGEYREYQKKYQKEYQILNREKRNGQVRAWITANPEKSKEIFSRSCAKRRGTVSGKLNGNVSRQMRKSLQSDSKAGRHWEELVDFTVDQLKRHLEKLFSPEMNWGNYGTVWEIDHKVPIAAFNFEHPGDIDFRLCWSLRNLQPLEASKNMSKGARVERPFQPSLALAAGGLR